MSAITIPDSRLDTFYTQNPNFDILQINLSDQAALSALNWQGLDRDTTLALLKTYQRLLRLNPDPAVAMRLLAVTLVQGAPDGSILISVEPPPSSGISSLPGAPQPPAGTAPAPATPPAQPAPQAPTGPGSAPGSSLDSAHAIAAIPEPQFVAQVGPLVGGEQVARDIHQNATAVKAKTTLLWANVQNLVASPYFRALRVNNVGGDINQFENFPTYQQLFGSLNFCSCDECRSIFGPAAYFVDLMRIIEQYITSKNQIDPHFTLDTRRPDLAKIALTCENTNNLVPHLDIVNNVLAGMEVAFNGADPSQSLASATYPWILPFNLPLEQVRGYLCQLNTDLATVYKTFNAPEDTVARESVGLSVEEYNLIVTPKADRDSVRSAFGLTPEQAATDAKLLEMLNDLDTFLNQTGLPRQEVQNLLYQNLSQTERETGIAHTLYINQLLPDGAYLRLSDDATTIDNLNLATLDRIHRFVRLARKLNWSFADLDWVLTSLHAAEIAPNVIRAIAKIHQLQVKLKLPLDMLCGLWYDVKTTGIGEGSAPADLFDRVFNHPGLLKEKAPYHPQYDGNPAYQDDIQPWRIDEQADQGSSFGRNRLLAALRLSDSDLAGIAQALWNQTDPIPLTVGNLSLLYRTSTILGLLKLRVPEYQLLLNFIDVLSFTGTEWAPLASVPQTTDQLIDRLLQLTSLVEWLRASNFNIYELHYIVNRAPAPALPVVYSEQQIRDYMASLWQSFSAALPDPSSNLTKQQELVKQLAAFLQVEPDLAAALLEYAAMATNTPDYAKLLLTTIEPTDARWAGILSFFEAISKMLVLVKKLALSATELTSLTKKPAAYGLDAAGRLTVKNIVTLSTFKQLTNAFNDTQDQLINHLATPSPQSLAKITGWDAAQIQEVAGHFGEAAQVYGSVEGINRLKQAFGLNISLGASAAFHDQLLALAGVTGEQAWQGYNNAAQSAIAVVKAKYNDDAWAKVSAKVEGALNELKRNALTGFAMWKLKDLGISNLRTLSEYVLIDVETTGCSSISLIKQAILSAQMYLQRCRLGLESGVMNVDIPQVWWEWIMNYRIWEANRKVFLYPENYIEPDLRKNKSDLFKELESELLQSDITQESVEAAYNNYFDKFAELAKLRIAASYRGFVKQPNNPDPVDTLFLFGRTATDPATYYYRECIDPTARQPTWTPWSKIDISIQSDYISPVFAFHKLFVFWVEFKETASSAINNNQTQKTTVKKATIKYTFQTVSGKWVQPQTLSGDITIAVAPDDYVSSQSGIDVDTQKIFWKKVYPLPICDPGPELEKILILFGDTPDLPTKAPSSPPVLADTDRSRFDNQIYAALQLGYGAHQAGIVGRTSLIPAMTLSGDLGLESRFLILPKWKTSGLSASRSSLAATRVGNLVIFAGGTGTNYQRSSIVDIYDIKTGKWATAALSQASSDLVATAVGDLALFAGGENAQGYSNVVDIYDAGAKQWHTAVLSQARSFLSATTVGNLALFAGGISLDGVPQTSNVVDMYDATSNTWRTAALSQPRSALAATAVGNLALFAGGSGARGQLSNVVDIYDAATNQWRTAALSQPRSFLAATTVGHLAIFAGGQSGADINQVSSIVDIFDATTNTWSTATLSEARSFLTATTVGHLAIFAGGTKVNDLSFAVDIYDARANQWTTATLSAARSQLAATAVGNLAFFAGGSGQSGQPTSIIDIYDTTVLRENYLGDAVNAGLAGTFGLSESLKANASILTVKNQLGWFTFDNGDEAFLVRPQSGSLQPISDHLDIQTDSQGALELAYRDSSTEAAGKLAFSRLTTGTLGQLSQRAFIGGVDHLLTLDSQLTSERDFSRFKPSDSVVPPQSTTLDFNGAYGLYFQEIFFHAPFLVANTLNANQRFAEAQKWYHYIFNPTAQPAQTSQGLVGEWPLNEGNGTTIQDKVGTNSGTVQGAPNWQAAADFPAGSRPVLQFDGESGSVTIAASPSLNLLAQATWEAWVKPSAQSGEKKILFRELPGGVQTIWQDGAIAVGAFVGSAWHIAEASGYVADQWYHVAGVLDGTNLHLFVDGEWKTSVPCSTLEPGTQAWHVASWTGSGYNFKGQIANVRIWNVALSAVQILENASRHPSDRFWRYLPFRGNTLEKLQAILMDDQAIKAYNDNPFDPHAIAQVRIGAYPKAIVMKYIDNLLDWGDSLFAQDTWESITQATTLYLLAYDLLGPRPENMGSGKLPQPSTFQQIKDKYGKDIPQFLIELEQRVSNGQGSAATGTPLNDVIAYFCVGENEQFIAYWDRVEDRLYKIRHCENIEGLIRQLALFEPPLDPNQLVRSVAAGNAPSSVAAGLAANVPHYRFEFILERARIMVSTVIQLGSSFLSALEKKDAEQLALLRSTQERAIVRLIQTTREKQISDAQATVDSLNKSLDAATHRLTYYQKLIDTGLSNQEQVSLSLTEAALAFEGYAAIENFGAAVAYAVPTIFGLADGGFSPGGIISSVAAAASGVANTLNQGSSLAATMAQYDRRKQDWQLQLQIAQDDIALITQQLAATQLQVDIANTELTTQQKNIEQADEIENFFKQKFSNQDLYQWMVGRLSTLYFETYKTALDLALAAQKAYQYELNQDDTYIGSDYWDSLKKGLLAGEGLMLGLNQLEKAYVAGNVRRLEIEKTISLLQLDPKAFLQLKTTGKCQFDLSEALFDYDFPSHYCRQIKTISISIPAVVGPYQNIKATLTQVSDQTLTIAKPDAVKYLLDPTSGSMPDTSTLRSSWRLNQKIALSRGVNDTGLFELNFRDERYLPFEGTGAVSKWELRLPKATNRFDFDSLSDIIINLSYTALDAGDGPFKQAVHATLKNYAGSYYISINQAFPGSWYAFLNPKPGTKTQQLTLNISEAIIPPHITKPQLTDIYLKLDSPVDISGRFGILTIMKASSISIDLGYNSANLTNPSPDEFVGDWIISVDPTQVSGLTKDGFLDPDKVKDIELVLFYQGEIDWTSDVV